ncbi:MAG: LysM peptidoglycan-binding domain-containing protein [Polyangiaceae bacterium]|nr:LysM peptidoglycan-binding domain-containing protein [Polyangiaceae bacterium]
MRLHYLIVPWLLPVLLVWSFPGNARPLTIHTVYPGQRLGSIAKRYHVTVEALCEANQIGRADRLRVGQKLIIPAKGNVAEKKASDPEHDLVAIPPGPSAAGSEDEASEVQATEPEAAAPDAPLEAQPSEGTAVAPEQLKAAPKVSRVSAPLAPKGNSQRSQKPGALPRVHTVYSGQRLGSIAKRYQVSVDAICNASGISRGVKLRPGQKLLIPTKDDKDGERARQMYHGNFTNSAKTAPRRAALAKGSKVSWKSYVKPARKRGYVTLTGYSRSWKGYAFGPSGRVLPKARTEISALLNASPAWPEVEPRLMRLLVELSDKFGGRELRIISGLREKSFVQDSRHHLGRAVDFTIIGVPNEALRDYLLTLDRVGVGYYPNSTFVHLDVREEKAHWVDYSGPGEAPVLAPRSLAAENLRRAEQAASH